MSDKATKNHLQKIQQRFLDCLDHGISIEEPIQKLMNHDMHTVLDLCFGPLAIQDERFYVELCPFYTEIEVFLPNIRVKAEKFYSRIYQLSNHNSEVLHFVLEKHFSSLWIVDFGMRNSIDMIEYHSPYFANIVNLNLLLGRSSNFASHEIMQTSVQSTDTSYDTAFDVHAYCDDLHDYWPSDAQHPLGYHPTSACDKKHTNTRGFVAWMTADADGNNFIDPVRAQNATTASQVCI